MTASDLPLSYRRAEPTLEPAIVGIVPERLRREAAGDARGTDAAALSGGEGELRLSATVAAGAERVPVSPSLCALWRRDPDEVITASFESARPALALRNVGLTNLAPGAFRVRHPQDVPWFWRSPRLREEMRRALGGTPVLLVATGGAGFVAGAEDAAALAAIASAAADELRAHPRDAVTASPLVLREEWEDFAWTEATTSGWRGRGATRELERSVAELDGAFSDAGTATSRDVVERGLPVRRLLGMSAHEPSVLEAWNDLALASGMDARGAQRVVRAARDTLGFFDSDPTRLGAVVDRRGFRPHHLIQIDARRRGALVTVERKTDVSLLAADVAETPAARAAGATIHLDEEYDDTLSIAEDVAARLRPFGVGALILGDPDGDIPMIVVPESAVRIAAAAGRRIGDPTLVRGL